MTAPRDQETAKAARVRGVVVPMNVPDEAVWATQYRNSVIYDEPMWLWFVVTPYTNDITKILGDLGTPLKGNEGGRP